MNTIGLIRHHRVATILAAGLLAVLSINTPQASAQIISAKVITKGMACPFCAYGVEKKLGQVEGVTGVTVDMKTNTTNLTIAKGSSLDLAAIHEAVRKAGFTMGAVTISAIGTLTEQDGRLVLAVRGTKQKFLLFEAPENEHELHDGKKPTLLSPATGKALRNLMEEKTAIRVTGKVHEHPQGPDGLQIEKYEVVK